MFHLKCQMYQTHHRTLYPQAVHHPVIHSHTHMLTRLVSTYHGTRHYVKCFTYIDYFNLHNSPMKTEKPKEIKKFIQGHIGKNL